MDTKSHDALTSAIELFPTLKAFAAALGVDYQVVQQWLANGNVPAPHCPPIEKLTGVPCEHLNSRVDWSVVRNSHKKKSSRRTNL